MWEYRTIHIDIAWGDVVERLSKLGADGWELVAIWGSVNPIFFFKRRQGPFCLVSGEGNTVFRIGEERDTGCFLYRLNGSPHGWESFRKITKINLGDGGQ